MNDSATPPARDELRAVGMRATAQRALILDILRRNAGHLDAEEIHAAARSQDAGLSLATVYRTLRSLRQAGLIQQRYFGPAHPNDHYEPVRPSDHHHLSCRGCGRVEEFETALVRKLADDLQTRHGWTVEQATILIEGLCPACRQAAGI